MTLICPACGHTNTEGALFCSMCASPLAVPVAARRERKFATVLFADLVGSTTLAEQKDPELVQAAIGSVFDRLAKVIDGYGGLLEKYMGDAILAVFGVPVVHEDDAERAVRAGLDMQAVLSEMNRLAAAEGKPQLEMRIGIESGEILVDLERAVGTRDRMLTGDAVNTSARLQGLSDIGHVLVGPTARESTKAIIDFSAPKLLELKGKAGPVPAYTALRIAAQHAGERAPLGIESRMVGRDAELAVLQQTLHRVEKDGRPALVTVLAPAGSGKTRLVRELQRYVDSLDTSFFWRTGRCLPYGAAAYSGLVDAIQAQCEVLDDDLAETVEAKIERSAQDLVGDADTADALKSLLGVHTDRSMGRERLFDLWRRYLERMAARYPLVLVLEDIHWADEGLLDFIEFLADWGQGGILIVTLARPELLDRRSNWGGGIRNYAAVNLDPLGPQENHEMLTDLLGEALPQGIKALICERSEGNPLYTEEIVRMFIDRQVLVASREHGWELATPIEDIEIPRSIHNLIAARIDGLASDEKSLLQDASVVGRIFWSGIAARLAQQDTIETRKQLGRLRMKELITVREPSSFSDEREFGFHHALIRDVAYESLPKKLRAGKHIEVARWAESHTTADRDDAVELIAAHLHQALSYLLEVGAPALEIEDLQGQAFAWAVRAAEGARRVWQIARALDWYSRALDIAEQLGQQVAETASVWESFALTASGVLPEEETLQAFRRAIDMYEADGKEADAARVKAEYSIVLFRTGDEQGAIVMAEEAVSLLRSENDERSLARTLTVLALLYWLSARAAEAETLTVEAIELASRSGDRKTEASALATRAVALSILRENEAGLELTRLSHEIATEIGDLPLLLSSGSNIGFFLTDLGDPDGAGQKVAEDMLELARRHGHRRSHAFIAMNLCEVYGRQGRFGEAEALVAQALGEAPQTWARVPATLEVLLGELDAYRGNLEEARSHIEKARSYSSTDPEVQRVIPLISALVAYFEQDHASALDQIREATALRAAPVVVAYPDPIRIAVKLSVAAGDREEACAFRNLFEQQGLLAQAFRQWCDGLLAADPVESSQLFADAAERFEELRVPLFQAQCLIDLARVNKALGLDYLDLLRKAMDFFESCGARLLLEEAAQLQD